MDISGLSDAMTPILSLCIHGGVPVTVIEYDGIGPGQVDSDASTTGGQDEAEDTGILVKPLHQDL